MSFEVGDSVISLRFGFGVVVEKQQTTIRVRFGKIENPCIYGIDGKYLPSDVWPSLYHSEGFTPPSCKEPERKYEFKPFDKVLIRDVIKDITWKDWRDLFNEEVSG